METKVIDYLNFNKESVCCVLRDRNGEGRIEAKRKWLQGVFEDGLVLRKSAEPGKCFMEYVPAIDAWCPVEAEDYMFINCYRAEDKLKDYAKSIWREAVSEARIKHKKGFCVLLGKEDMPYLNHRSDFVDRGFILADTAEPYFELWYKPFPEFKDDKTVPRFADDLQEREVPYDGFVIYYSNQCPHIIKAVQKLEDIAKAESVKLRSITPQKAKDARLQPCVYNTFSLYYDGKFITHIPPTPSKFLKLIKSR